jgi:hypothetical protein
VEVCFVLTDQILFLKETIILLLFSPPPVFNRAAILFILARETAEQKNGESLLSPAVQHTAHACIL